MADDKTKKESILLEKHEEEVKPPEYTDKESLYLENLKKRVKYAQERRDEPHEEFDGMPYITYWQTNERWSNTYIQPKKDKTEIKFQSGTLRTKMFAFLATLEGLNLKPDLIAFDKNNIQLTGVSTGLEDIIDKTEEMENDEEKQILRQYELLKQGTIFIEEVWDVHQVIEKEISQAFTGDFKKKNWTTKTIKTEGTPIRNILTGVKVYLGNMRKYFIEDQPYVFTITNEDYEIAEKTYGEWDMWKHVTRKKQSFDSSLKETEIVGQWYLLDPPQGQVEIIKYQDLPNNEYQILINGIPMLPMGHPLPWGRYYNIAQQNLEPIRYDYAYGKSFTFKNKNLIQIMDEMMRLELLKNFKSLLPPLINVSGKYINQSVMMPGKITMGNAGDLRPVYEDINKGVNAGEIRMFQEIKAFIDQNTASATFTGQKEEGRATATEVLNLQRQSMKMAAITIASSALLEKKITLLRLNNILKNWFDPIDKTVDAARDVLKNKYRIVSRERNIEDEGPGLRFTVPMERDITPEELFANEESLGEQLNMPVRITAIKPKELEQAKLTWAIMVNPKPKKSDELSKLLFRAKIGDAMALGLPLNPEYVMEEFAEVWEENPNKLFQAGQPPLPQPGETQEGGETSIQKPTINQLQTLKEREPLAR